MSFAPSLTWMHLFPSGTSYQCPRGPQWLDGFSLYRTKDCCAFIKQSNVNS